MVYKKNFKLLISYNQNYKVGNQWIDGLMDQLDRWMDRWIIDSMTEIGRAS